MRKKEEHSVKWEWGMNQVTAGYYLLPDITFLDKLANF